MKNRFFHPIIDSLLRYESVLPSGLPPGLIDLPLYFGETLLGRAASDGSVAQVKNLLKLGANVNSRDLRGIPPIVHASISGRKENLILLLDQGADLEAADANGRTALHYAFLIGDFPLIEAILERGGSIHSKDIDGRSATDFAFCSYGDKDKEEIRKYANQVLYSFGKPQSHNVTDDDDSKGPKFPDLRGATDFQRLDRIRMAINCGFQGIAKDQVKWLFGIGIDLGLGIGFLFDNVYVGLLTFYMTLVLRLALEFLYKRPAPLPELGKGVPGASVREVSLILRAASRNTMSQLDTVINQPVRVEQMEILLWLLALIAPLPAAIILVSLTSVMVLYPEAMQPIALVIMLSGILVLISHGIFRGSRLIVWITERVFSTGAIPLLVRKITARQSALSNHINSFGSLRDDAGFADGGVLYLRSFEFDGSFTAGGIDFELMLLHLFQGRAPVFALNTDPKSRGTLNLKTDADWLKTLNELLPRAGLILMIPATTPGVLLEMKILEKNKLLDKTLFVAPPDSGDGKVFRIWESLRFHPDLRHLEIPPYCDAGFLFRLNRDGSLVEAGPLGIDTSPPQFRLPLRLASAQFPRTRL